MAHSNLNVQVRTETGKGAARRLRGRGLIPAIFYGAGADSVTLAVDPRELRKALATDAGENTLLKLSVANGADSGVNGQVAIVKDLQRDPVTNREVHADLMLVDMTQAIRVEVPVRCVGTAEGVVQGGIMEQIRRDIAVECLPDRIPPEIILDVSALGIGDAIHVADLPLGEGVTSPHEVNFTIVTIVAPVKEEEPEVDALLAEGEVEGEAAPDADAPPGEASADEGGGTDAKESG